MNRDNSINRLATAPVGRLLWEYSLPGVVGMLVVALYNVVDRMFIGHVVGPEAIAGLALTFPLMNITTAIGVLVGVGSASRVSIALGRGDRRTAELILGNALTLTLVNAAIYIAVFTAFIDPILRAFGAGDATLPYAREYMLWVMPGLLMTNVSFGFNNIMRASGYPVKAMVTMLIGAVANVALDSIFVYEFGWGMRGAALATDIAMALSGWFVMAHFCRRRHTLAFAGMSTLRLRGAVVLGVISIGAAPSVINVASCLINALINRTLVAIGGDLAIGAAGIFVTYTSLLTTLTLGICMGLQPILGYNYGAGHIHRLRRAFWLAVASATVICTMGEIVGLTLPGYIARAFTTDDVLIESTVNCLQLCLWAFATVGFQVVATSLFQSIGNARASIFLSLARQVLFLIPLLLWLPGRLGVDGVWLSFPLSDTITLVVTAIMVWREFRILQAAQRIPAPAVREETAGAPASAAEPARD